MALEHEQHLNPVNSLGHVEGLSSVSERVVRKKEHHRQNRRGKKGEQGRDEQSPEEPSEEKAPESRDGHIDFRA